MMLQGWPPARVPSHPAPPCTIFQQVPGLREAEPELGKAIDSAQATIAANGAANAAAAESLASAAKAAEAAGSASAANSAAAVAAFTGAAASAASAFTPPKSREGNAAGFPTAMPATPSNPNMLFSTINAETLEASAQNVSFPVPEDKVCVVVLLGGWVDVGHPGQWWPEGGLAAEQRPVGAGSTRALLRAGLQPAQCSPNKYRCLASRPFLAIRTTHCHITGCHACHASD